MSAATTTTTALALKVVLTPVLIGGASLAGRRWGSAVSGWLVGIPLTSGPIAFFLALEFGTRFAATAAVGVMGGAASQAAFCLAYAWTARRAGLIYSLIAATAAFGVATAVLDTIALPVALWCVAVVVGLGLGLAAMPRGGAQASRHLIGYPAWDIPARMAIATGFVIGLTAVAPALGPRLAGLIAPFPLYAGVLAAFAHRGEGPASGIGVLRGLLLGLFSFVAFFLVLATSLVDRGIVLAFALAIIAALAVQGASLYIGRRMQLA